MLIFTLFACTTATDTAETEDPAAHACEHAATSEGSITAGAAMDTTAGALPIDAEPYTAVLTAGAPGYLAIEVTGDTPALLFLGVADVAANLYSGAEEVGLPEGAPNEACATDIPEHFDLDLHTAGTWYLELGPAAIDQVWISLASAEGHAHEE